MADGKLGRVVVFGATSAMAQAAVRLLAARGSALVLVGRAAERLADVAADARVRGARQVEVLTADLDQVDGHDGLLRSAAAALGGIDAVIIAQGVLATSDACEADPALAEAMLRTNLVGPALLAQRAAGLLAEGGGGTLVGISSVAGDRGRQSNYAYGAAKGGFSIFLAGLRNRYARRGVHVLTVKPGFVDTPMTAGIPKTRLFVGPEVVARALLRGVERRTDVLYVPGFWRAIMLVIRHVPERLFKRLSL